MNEKPKKQLSILSYYRLILIRLNSEKESRSTSFSRFKLYSSKTLPRSKILNIIFCNIEEAIRRSLLKYSIKHQHLNILLINNLLRNKHTHKISLFKDELIYTFNEEFLKRSYKIKEVIERLPKISNYYKNYFKFFCNPLFRDFKANLILQKNGDSKAELYYNCNYNKKKENDKHHNHINNTQTSRIKSIFTKTLKEEINNNNNLSLVFSSNGKQIITKTPHNVIIETNNYIDNINTLEQETLNSYHFNNEENLKIIRASDNNDNITEDSILVNLTRNIKKHNRIRSIQQDYNSNKHFRLNLNNIEFDKKQSMQSFNFNCINSTNNNGSVKILPIKVKTQYSTIQIKDPSIPKTSIKERLISKLGSNKKVYEYNNTYSSNYSIPKSTQANDNNKQSSLLKLGINKNNLNTITNTISNSSNYNSISNNNSRNPNSILNLAKNKLYSSYQYQFKSQDLIKQSCSPEHSVNKSPVINKPPKLLTRSIKISSHQPNHLNINQLMNISVNVTIENKKPDTIINISCNPNINTKTRNRNIGLNSNPIANTLKTFNKQNKIIHQFEEQTFDPFIRSNENTNINKNNHLQASIKNLKTIINNKTLQTSNNDKNKSVIKKPNCLNITSNLLIGKTTNPVVNKLHLSKSNNSDKKKTYFVSQLNKK